MLGTHAFALSNADDEYGLKMLQGIKANQFSYGFREVPDVGRLLKQTSNVSMPNNLFQGEIKKLDFNGMELSFNDIPIKAKLLGKFNAYNLLSVWSASSLLGFDMNNV